MRSNRKVFFSEERSKDTETDESERWTRLRFPFLKEEDSTRRRRVFARYTFETDKITDSTSTVAQKQELSTSSNAIVRGIDQQHFTSALFFRTRSRSRPESERDLSLSPGN